MEPVREALLESLAHIAPQACAIPFYSTVYGEPLGDRLLDADYWWRNVRQPVLFGPCMESIARAGLVTVVELGPHPVLSFAIHEAYASYEKSVETIASLRRDVPDQESILRAVGRLYQLGYALNWNGLSPKPSQRIAIPTHPFLKQKLWSETNASHRSRFEPNQHPMLGTAMEQPTPTWTSRLDLRQRPFLTDHQVRQVCVLPAAAILDCGLAVGRVVHPTNHFQLQQVRIEQACLLHPDRPKVLRNSYDPKERKLQISVRESDHDEWSSLARMRIGTATGERPNPLDLKAIESQCSHHVMAERIYAYCQRLGLQYGPLFQGVTHGYQGTINVSCMLRKSHRSHRMPRIGSSIQRYWMLASMR